MKITKARIIKLLEAYRANRHVLAKEYKKLNENAIAEECIKEASMIHSFIIMLEDEEIFEKAYRRFIKGE